MDVTQDATPAATITTDADATLSGLSCFSPASAATAAVVSAHPAAVVVTTTQAVTGSSGFCCFPASAETIIPAAKDLASKGAVLTCGRALRKSVRRIQKTSFT